ncbi:PREDICTED: uncharacterized protein LOC106818649 isoform X2 [Priapulus caudatus]|nr:PREDICTED: uncharacterized protein LOC106818649 isoform X2 [Priapulus caudatus]
MFCTYVVMDHETLSVVTIITIDKRHVGKKSPNMEKECLIRVMALLAHENVNVTEVVTDAHPQITAYMRKNHPRVIPHSYDVWHGAKNLGKRLNKAAQKAGCEELRPWIKHIVNHFWFCCREADGSIHKLQGLW